MSKITEMQLLPAACLNSIKLLPEDIQSSDIIQEILLEIYNGWPGKTGEERVDSCVNVINKRIPQYANAMGKTQLETLTIYAKSRKCNYANWFQDHYLPDLSDVVIVDTVDDFKKKYPSGKYICPCCNAITTDYQECNSGAIVNKTKKSKGSVCDWKVYGLFGDLGKGIKVIVKDKFEEFPKPIAMFKPIEMTEIVEAV